MIRLIFFISFFYTTQHFFAQEKVVSGKVFNDLDETLSNVVILVNGNIKKANSDCKGKFKIDVKFGDTIIFKKDGYSTNNYFVSTFRKIEHSMNFNYSNFIEELENDTSKNKFIPGGCQPLYVINGNSIKSLEEKGLKITDTKKVKSIIVLKGEKAAKFGRFGTSGVLWVTTYCEEY